MLNSFRRECGSAGVLIAPDVWERLFPEGVHGSISLRYKVERSSLWVEFSFGVRYDEVEEFRSTALQMENLAEATTVGFELSHLVPGFEPRGWTIELTRADRDIRDIMDKFWKYGITTSDLLSDKKNILNLCERREKEMYSDPFILNGWFTVPIILFLWGKYDTCLDYMNRMVLELRNKKMEETPLFDAVLKLHDAIITNK